MLMSYRWSYHQGLVWIQGFFRSPASESFEHLSKFIYFILYNYPLEKAAIAYKKNRRRSINMVKDFKDPLLRSIQLITLRYTV